MQQLSVDNIAEQLMRNADDKHLLIGPVVERDDEPEPYCIVCGSSNGKPWHGLVYCPHGDDDRSTLMVALVPKARGVVIQVFDDELQLAGMCHAIWPCDKTERVLAGIREERQQAA